MAGGCGRGTKLAPERTAAFLVTYADIAVAAYGAALSDARALSTSIEASYENPRLSVCGPRATAWITARRSYAQTEAYRFYGGPIDSVELLVNTWPVDENYLESEDGRTGIVADEALYPELSPRTLAALNLRDGETSVSTGYHAIEFLLWGRDRSATGPGDRSFHDYDTAQHARRRGEYLRAAAALLVENLATVDAAWRGEYRAAFLARPAEQALALAVKGLGSLSGGELLGERLTVAYETRSQENEHSCFSDNTHEDLRFDAVGIQNVCLGRYAGVVRGVGLSELVRGSNPALAAELEQRVAAAVNAVGAIPAPFDQAILGDDSSPGRLAIQRAIQALRAEADAFAKVASTFDLRLLPTAIGRHELRAARSSSRAGAAGDRLPLFRRGRHAGRGQRHGGRHHARCVQPASAKPHAAAPGRVLRRQLTVQPKLGRGARVRRVPRRTRAAIQCTLLFGLSLQRRTQPAARTGGAHAHDAPARERPGARPARRAAARSDLWRSDPEQRKLGCAPRRRTSSSATRQCAVHSLTGRPTSCRNPSIASSVQATARRP